MKVEPVPIKWHGGLSIYASESFLNAVSDEYGWLGGFNNRGNQCCILPYTIIYKAKVKMIRFRVETIIVSDDFTAKEEKDFLNKTIDYFRKIEVDIVIPATTNAIFRTYPDGAIAAPYGTYIVDLSQSEVELWNSLHQKHRNVIRNAKKIGVQIYRGKDYKAIAYRLIKDTFKRSNMPYMSYNEFNRLIEGLAENIEIFVGEYNGEILGCAVIPFSNHSAYYVYGGGVPKPLTGAMNLLQWEAILYFRNLGVKYYDFCGVRINPEKDSKQAGLKMFKERFGPRLVQGYMWKYPINHLRSAIYTIAVRILRGGDIVDAEHHKMNQSIV